MSQHPEHKEEAAPYHMRLRRDEVHETEDGGQRAGLRAFTGLRFWSQLVLKLAVPETFQLLNILGLALKKKKKKSVLKAVIQCSGLERRELSTPCVVSLLSTSSFFSL